MAQPQARPIITDESSEIAIGIFDEDTETPAEVLRHPAPQGFPADLRPHLADFMARGFNVAIARRDADETQEDVPSLADFAPSPRGRPTEAETEREGREGAKFRANGLTYGEIARHVCRYRSTPHHRCKKPCTDRIRQAVETHQTRVELERLSRGDQSEVT
jgi:hypothetical protein